MGNGAHNIPGSIVSVDTAPSKREENGALTAVRQHPSTPKNAKMNENMKKESLNLNTLSVSNSINKKELILKQSIPLNFHRIPHIIWVIGGPGSNKATLCLKAVGKNPGWGHIR